jgi:hypothetical protein
VKVSDVTLTLFAWTDIPSMLLAKPQHHPVRHRSDGCRAVGRRGQGERVADPPTAGRLPRSRPRLRQLGRARLEAGVRAGGVTLQGPRMDRLQVHAINDPGLGAAIDFDLIERHKVAVQR